MEMVVNQLIEWGVPNNEKYRLERVLWISPDRSTVALFDITHYQKSFPYFINLKDLQYYINAGDASFFLGKDPYEPFLFSGYLSVSETSNLNSRWSLIEPLVGKIEDRVSILDKHNRGSKIAALGIEGKNKIRQIYFYLRLFWRGGQTKGSLLSDFRKRGQRKDGKPKEYNVKPGRTNDKTKRTGQVIGITVDENIKRIFRTGVSYFNQGGQLRKGQSLASLYRKILYKFFTIDGGKNEKGEREPILPDKESLPSEIQFRYWFNKEYSLKKRITIRKGKHFFNQKVRALIGDSRMHIFGPGSLYQVDASILDVYLVSSIDRKRIIGKAVLYVVIDVFSELIVGYSLTLEGPSWAGAELALLNAFSNKVESCAELGITIDGEKWDVEGVCEGVLGDNGEFKSINSDNLPMYLDVNASLTPAYRPDWKAYVERFFLLVKGYMEWIAGMSYPDRRGDPKYKLDACLTLNEMRKIIVDLIITYNTTHVLSDYRRDIFMIQDQVNPVPIDLWNWGIKNRTGHLRHFSKEKIKASLMPKAEAKVTEYGILFNGLHYKCQKAIDEEWFEIARIKGTWPVTIAYDYDTSDYIYLFLSENEYIRCQLMEKDAQKGFGGKNFYEIKDHNQTDEDLKDALKSKQQQANAVHDAKTEAIVSKAQEDTEAARGDISDTALSRGIQENRAAEKDLEKDKRAGKENRPEPTIGNNGIEVPIITPIQESPKPEKTMDIYRRANAARKQEANSGEE